MPQQPDPTPVTDWRAEPIPGTELWQIVIDVPGLRAKPVVARGVTKSDAKLIANAPAKGRLCEELADALEAVWKLIDNDDLVRNIENDHNKSAFATQGMAIVVSLKKAHEALTKAGRVPQ